MKDSDSAPPEPAATVLPLRATSDGLEVLLVRRARRDGSPGIWVFPGGKVEAAEHREAGDEILMASRLAAVRETREEAGIELRADALRLIARWITPPMAQRRFDTWFFACEVAPDVSVAVDQGEIIDYAWWSAPAAIEARNEGALELAPPTFVTLHWFLEFTTVDEALGELVQDEVVPIHPNVRPIEGGACMLYPGDAGYEDGELEREGGRNRLWSLDGRLRYERIRG